MVLMPVLKRRSNDVRRFDWTRDQPPPTTTDFQQRTRENVDWSKSPLGPMSEWPSSLRQMVLLCMADTSPSAVLYGPVGETAIVYNDEFASLIGNKHPKLQGQLLTPNALSDLCPTLESVWQRQAADGCTETVRNQRVRQDWLGFVEEKTYSWKFVPIIGGNGLVSGSLVTVEDENKTPPRRERSKSAVREFGNVVKNAIDHTAKSALKLDEHFSGRSCNCEKLWQATQRMEHNKAKYEKFADYAPVGIAALDTSYQVEWANKAYYDVMAQTPDSNSILDYIHPDDVDRVRTLFEMGAFRDGSFTFECRLKKWASRPAVSPSEALPEPSPAWILVSAYREADAEQNTMCWIIDITQHKNAEIFLRKRMDEALEMKRQKERFIDLISHEIRNPLSAMMHCTDDIIDSTNRDTAESISGISESAHTIAYCTQHIRNIVGDVLTMSKLDSRLVDICPVPAQPAETIQNALKIFQGELRSSGTELKFEKDASLEQIQSEWLLFDPNRMLQVLINFVTNAIKVLKDRPKREITVKLSASKMVPCKSINGIQCVQPRSTVKAVDFGDRQREQSIYLIITVQDTGPGLDREEMTSLFERFAQANPKTESKYGGSGLGLFISRDLTELQGGRIGVSSTPGVGSTFVFSIEAKETKAPTSPPKLPQIEIPTRLRNPSTTSIASPMVTVTQPPLHTTEKKPPIRRILVVEDNAINQKVLANQLRKRGYEVVTATHGEEALSQLHMSAKAPATPPLEQPFDVVLMDIEMPVMDGLTCTQRIREWEEGRGGERLPIIAVTANVRSEHGSKALEVGMDAVTTKPYRIEELVGRIEEVTGMA